jgi:hypothetical protein
LDQYLNFTSNLNKSKRYSSMTAKIFK